MDISILGCGWLGLPLAKKLASNGHRVLGSTTNSEKLVTLKDNDIEPFLLGLNPELEESNTPFFDSELLFINIPPRNHPEIASFHERQIQSILNKAESGTVQRIIFASSTSVYPNTNGTVKEEDAITESFTRSGVSLKNIENLFLESDFKCVILRFGGLYGPERHPGRFLAGRQNLSGGTSPINMIHLEDCLNVLSLIIEQPEISGIFNACSPHHPTRKEFYTKAAKDLGVAAPSFNDEISGYKEVNSDKLIQALKYEFLH